MLSRTARLLVVLALLDLTAPVACSSGQSQPTTPEGSEAPGPVRVFTDTDVVTDVAASPSHVYVATQRGILKFPTAGGAPTRLTRADGLPDDEVLAVAVSDDGNTVWAATPHGVARSSGPGGGERFALAGDPQAQPSIGTPTALLATETGVLLGATQGLARFDGTRWSRLTDRYQVTDLTRDGARTLVATAQSGVLVLAPDFGALDEHGTSAGLPDDLVRSLVPVGGGKVWALTQSPTAGASLAYYDGSRWYSYTSERIRARWMALVPSGDGAALVVPGALYNIVLDRGDEFAPTGAAPAGNQRHVALQPVAYEPPPPPPAPPAPPVRGRGHGRGAAPAHSPVRPPGHLPAGRGQHAPPVFLQVVGGDAGAGPHRPARPDAGALRLPDAGPRQPLDAGVPPSLPDAAVPTPPAPDAGASPVNAHGRGAVGAVVDAGAAADGGVAAPATGLDAGTPTAGSPAPATALPPIRVRDVPAPAFPVDAPHGGPTLDAPTFGLVRAGEGVMPTDALRVDVSGRQAFVTRTGLGVARLGLGAASTATDFRVHDLSMQQRPLSLATDARGNVWLVSGDGGAVRYDGRTFTRVRLEDDPNVHPLMFWSRGNRGAAVARVGDGNVLRGYRLEGSEWRRVADGPVETYGPGAVDAKFLAADERGRLWVGLRVRGTGRVRELGVAVLDPNTPVATQYNSNVPEAGGENGSRRAPDDITAVEFDSAGDAWFAGLDGATEITPQGVRRFREAEGLRGDQVSALARPAGDRIYFATPEGLGAWDGQALVFPVEGSSGLPRVIALAVDASGNLWGAGPRGAWKYDGHQFQRVGRGQGLPTEEFTDLAVDAQNRVWFVNGDGLVLFDQATAQRAR